LIRLIGFDRRPASSVGRIVNCPSIVIWHYVAALRGEAASLREAEASRRETVGDRHARRSPPVDAKT